MKEPEPEQDRTKMMRLVAYEKIKTKILQNKLDLRRRLNEKQFTPELKLSRTPIREALIMLQKENLITRDEEGGFYVRRFSIKDIQDIYDFREMLERASADLVVSNVTDENLLELSKILHEVEATIKDGNPIEGLLKGLEFHIRIIELSKNSMTIQALKNAYDLLHLVGWSYQKIEMCTESYQEHKRILFALKNRDVHEFQRQISEHISKAKERGFAVVKDDPERVYYSP